MRQLYFQLCYFLCLVIATLPLSATLRMSVLHSPEQQSDEQVTRTLSLRVSHFDKAIFTDVVLFGDVSESLYLGAATQGQDIFALSRAIVVTMQNGQKALRVVPQAPDRVSLFDGSNNGEGTATRDKENPFYNARISQLALYKYHPVLTFEKEGDPRSNKQICFLQRDPGILGVRSGIKIFTHGDRLLHDAQGMPTDGIVGLAASDEYSRICAAVKPENGLFGEQGSGIALLFKSEHGLEFLDVQQGGPGNRAVPLDATHARIQESVSDILIDPNSISLHWDRVLHRLFIALKVTRSNNNQEGGGIALFVGRFHEELSEHEATGKIIHTNKLIVDPIVSPEKSLFFENSTDHIIGFYASENDSLASTLHHVSTMRTVTGQSYIIVNGGVSDDTSTNATLFALPLVSDESDYSNVGKLAKKDDLLLPAGAADDLVLATNEAARIGAGPLPLQDSDQVHTIIVKGNAVFVTLSGDRSDPNHEAGIFQSAALFDEHGYIRSWTPWQRVMGSLDPVFHAGLDNQGRFWYLTQDMNMGSTNVVKVTEWGKGDSSYNLSLFLSQEFPSLKGGIFNLVDFPSTTQGFDIGTFSMMVALGFDKVCLFETGHRVNGLFTPHLSDFDESQARVFHDMSFGSLCTADVSRIPQTGKNGWLFVAGIHGLFVLSDDDGNGWNTAPGLGAGFAGITQDFTFKRIGNFSHVRKVACDGTYLYVATNQALYRIPMISGRFSKNSVALGEEIIATPLTLTGSENNAFVDFVIVGQKGILATTAGLFVVADEQSLHEVQDQFDQDNWVEFVTEKGRSFGPVTRLFPVYNHDRTNANLFVLCGDYSYNVGILYHIDVHSHMMTPIHSAAAEDYLLTIGSVRSHFFTDGSFGFHTRSCQHENKDFLIRAFLSESPRENKSLSRIISLSLLNVEFSHLVGPLIRNSASGALFVPGGWGVQINE